MQNVWSNFLTAHQAIQCNEKLDQHHLHQVISNGWLGLNGTFNTNFVVW